jgi:hypothetical protein
MYLMAVSCRLAGEYVPERPHTPYRKLRSIFCPSTERST